MIFGVVLFFKKKRTFAGDIFGRNKHEKRKGQIFMLIYVFLSC